MPIASINDKFIGSYSIASYLKYPVAAARDTIYRIYRNCTYPLRVIYIEGYKTYKSFSSDKKYSEDFKKISLKHEKDHLSEGVCSAAYRVIWNMFPGGKKDISSDEVHYSVSKHNGFFTGHLKEQIAKRESATFQGILNDSISTLNSINKNYMPWNKDITWRADNDKLGWTFHIEAVFQGIMATKFIGDYCISRTSDLFLAVLALPVAITGNIANSIACGLRKDSKYELPYVYEINDFTRKNFNFLSLISDILGSPRQAYRIWIDTAPKHPDHPSNACKQTNHAQVNNFVFHHSIEGEYEDFYNNYVSIHSEHSTNIINEAIVDNSMR